MKEFKGFKLVERIPYQNFALIFWSGDEPSEVLEFSNKEECNNILGDVVNGRGIKVRYDFSNENYIVYPLRILKVCFVKEYEISHQDKEAIIDGGVFNLDVKFPNDTTIGLNKYQPTLIRE